MKISYSKNLYDNDGDVFEECILLHIDDSVILKIKNVSEIHTIIGNLNNIITEISENE